MQLGHQRLARIAQRQADDPSVRGVVAADDEPLAHEAVDDRGGRAFSHVELLRELPHCHRLTSQIGQHAELMAGDRMKLVAQLTVQECAEPPLHLWLELAVPVDQNLAAARAPALAVPELVPARRCSRDRHH